MVSVDGWGAGGPPGGPRGPCSRALKLGCAGGRGHLCAAAASPQREVLACHFLFLNLCFIFLISVFHRVILNLGTRFGVTRGALEEFHSWALPGGF